MACSLKQSSENYANIQNAETKKFLIFSYFLKQHKPFYNNNNNSLD